VIPYLWMVGAAYLVWTFTAQVNDPEPTLLEILGAVVVCPAVMVVGFWSVVVEFGAPAPLYPGVWSVWIPFIRVMVGLLSALMAGWRIGEVWFAWRARQ
jgi:hypothetical protein